VYESTQSHFTIEEQFLSQFSSMSIRTTGKFLFISFLLLKTRASTLTGRNVWLPNLLVSCCSVIQSVDEDQLQIILVRRLYLSEKPTTADTDRLSRLQIYKFAATVRCGSD